MKRLFVVFHVILFFIGVSTPGVGAADKSRSIQSLLGRLGFTISKVIPGKGGVYTVSVQGFSQKSNAIALSKPFKPFRMKAKVVKGKVYVDLATLKRNKYKVKKTGLVGQLVFPTLFVGFLKEVKDGNALLTIILNSLRRYKEQAYRKIGEARHKIRAARDLIDDCRISRRSIPKIRKKFSRIGLKTGKITRNKKGFFNVQITGATKSSKLKLTAKRTFSVVRVILKNDKIYIDQGDWFKVFSVPPRFWQQ